MKFTKISLDNLDIKKSRYVVMDDALEFFGIRVYPSGKKSFIVRIRQDGKQKLYTLGQFPLITAIEARKIAAPIIEQYQVGVDVKLAEKEAKAKDKTFTACVEEWSKTLKPTTQRDIVKCKKHGWHSWLNKPLKDITETMVLKLYDRRSKLAKNRARLEMAYLRAVWNFHKRNLNLGESPTRILNEERKGWNNSKTKTRRLDFETASMWYKALDSISQRDRGLFLLIYYTGMRSIEAKNLRWSDINLENRSLSISDTKNGKPLNIPLSTQAMALLATLPTGSEYVFSQVSRAGIIGPITSYSKSTAKLKALGVEFSPHDARRGFIVAGGVLGLNSYMIKQLVNHADGGDVHASYQTYTVAELRGCSQRICDHLETHLIATPNVVELHKVRS